MAQNTRDGLRAAMLNHPNMKAQRKTIQYFGLDVEVRQPSVGTAMSFADEEHKSDQALRMLLATVYVPGTDEPLFEEGDLEDLRNMPINEDFQRLMDTINSLMGVDKLIKEAAKK